jgi:hypothetical protein
LGGGFGLGGGARELGEIRVFPFFENRAKLAVFGQKLAIFWLKRPFFAGNRRNPLVGKYPVFG